MRATNFVYLLIVLGLAIASGIGFSATKFKYGLDVEGGLRFTYQMDSSKLTDDQRQNIERVKANILKILETRVQAAIGVVEGSVQRKGTDQFVVELPGATNLDEARNVLSTSAAIKFYHAKTVVSPIASGRRYEVSDEPVKFGGVNVYEFTEKTTGKKVAPGTPEYKAMIASWGEPILVGEDLANATGIQYGMNYVPQMSFTNAGSAKLERWSRTFKQENFAAVLDDKVLSIAPVKEGQILRDTVFIDGQFETAFVKQLSDLLNAGALPVELKELSYSRVDPTIGKTALHQILTAGYVAFAGIAIFIVAYYAFPGIVALLALLLYLLFTITTLKLLGATFSLAAIAGVILSVGMAIDANILIFERVKEELNSGKTLKAAIDLGFKRALPAIVDSNACTILTSFVLMSIGTGPVKGFASTLIIGVAISLFTAVTVTRWILTFLVGAGIGTNPNWYGLKRQWFGEKFEQEAVTKPFRIVERRNMYFLISLLTIVVPGIFFFMGGLKPNVEFMGGYGATFVAGNKTKADIDKVIESRFKGGNSKLAATDTEKFFEITIPDVAEFKGKKPDEVTNTITQAFGFTSEDLRGVEGVGPTVQKEAIEGAIKGVVLSTALIILYLAIRFGIGLGGFKVGIRFAMAAVGALLHDMLVVVALAAMFGYLLGWEVSALFITAMLTVVGFSTHDTIVIFDRIRENLHKPIGSEDIATLINRSITQSFARSINTSSMVIFTLGCLIFLGSATPDLRFFNTIMLCGIVSGTYSSIYNASPILYLIDRWQAKRGEEHTLLGIARRELLHAHVAHTEAPLAEKAATLESQGYGQVKRRRASSKPGQINIDEP